MLRWQRTMLLEADLRAALINCVPRPIPMYMYKRHQAGAIHICIHVGPLLLLLWTSGTASTSSQPTRRGIRNCTEHTLGVMTTHKWESAQPGRLREQVAAIAYPSTHTTLRKNQSSCTPDSDQYILSVPARLVPHLSYSHSTEAVSSGPVARGCMLS